MKIRNGMTSDPDKLNSIENLTERIYQDLVFPKGIKWTPHRTRNNKVYAPQTGLERVIGMRHPLKNKP